MPSLKEYRNRIASVKSTRKITSAMKMVAASKLRKAQSKAENSQPYADRMFAMLNRLVKHMDTSELTHPLIKGTGKRQKYLIIVVTANRGLCGGFNSFVSRMAKSKIRNILRDGKEAEVVCIGKKGNISVKREFADIVKDVDFVDLDASYDSAAQISHLIQDMLKDKEFDVCYIAYNKFRNVLFQIPTLQQLVPLESIIPANEDEEATAVDEEEMSETNALYSFEPSKDVILEELLPLNLSTQVHKALLDSSAGEHAARMTAMDNATNNAGDMIDALTLSYNRARQAHITTELIEIISGAEAV